MRRLVFFFVVAVLPPSLASAASAQELENPTPVEIRLLAPPERIDAPDGVVVPMDLDAGARPVVEVMIDGTGPWRFGIDWGASLMIVSEEVAEAAGLTAIGRAAPPPMEPRDVVEVPTVGLGGAAIEGLAAMVGGFLDPTVDGILGYNVFEGALLTLDYPAGEVRLEEGSLPPPDGREILALGAGFGEGRSLPSVPIEIGDVEVEAVLDSRSPLPLMMPDRLRDRFEATGPAAMARAQGPQTGTLEIAIVPVSATLRVGRFEAENPAVGFRLRPESGEEGVLYDLSVLGGPFLRNFALTLDVANGAVRFARDADGPIELPLPRPRAAPAPGSD